jgi:hypothetical protein
MKTMKFGISLLVWALVAANAQSFTSGSTGSDGALQLVTPGTISFDPRAFDPPLNPSGDNVYQFTSIYIGKGVTVKLSTRSLTGPVFWLSQGPVLIDGTIDLNGGDGNARAPSLAGAGGYPGGPTQKSGYRPEGFTPNVFLVPLVGGFGGDGGQTQGGGGGGGALLIASSTSITINGAVTADGGGSADGIGGGGGAIRLVAPVIDGLEGALSARGGQPAGADGRIRFEAFDNRFIGSLNETPYAQGRPFGLFLPPDRPASVRVLSIGGMPVTSPELTINQPAPLTIGLEARFIPPGSVLDVECFAKDGQSVTASATPLEGTFELSYARALIRFPSGSSHCQVKGAWKQPRKSERR